MDIWECFDAICACCHDLAWLCVCVCLCMLIDVQTKKVSRCEQTFVTHRTTRLGKRFLSTSRCEQILHRSIHRSVGKTQRHAHFVMIEPHVHEHTHALLRAQTVGVAFLVLHSLAFRAIRLGTELEKGV
mgnify:CR=1 FL=1